MWRDPYRLTVIEILLQRTRADTVAKFAPSFFARYRTWTALAQATVSELEDTLRPIGLSQRRAVALSSLAQQMLKTRSGLATLEMPGVGQYVYRAVRVGVRGESLAMVDSNFVRVLQRVFGGTWMADYRFDVRLQLLAQAVVDAADARRTNWAVLDLGSLVCAPRVLACDVCPLAKDCERGNAELASLSRAAHR